MSTDIFNLTAYFINLYDFSKRSGAITIGKQLDGKPQIVFKHPGKSGNCITLIFNESNITDEEEYKKAILNYSSGTSFAKTNNTFLEMLSKSHLLAIEEYTDKGTEEAKEWWGAIEKMDFILTKEVATRVLTALLFRKNFIAVNALLRKFPDLDFDFTTLATTIKDETDELHRIFDVETSATKTLYDLSFIIQQYIITLEKLFKIRGDVIAVDESTNKHFKNKMIELVSGKLEQDLNQAEPAPTARKRRL
jgi:hypothetical protein